MLRIVAGKLKGRTIHPPKGIAGFRPTADRVREAVFSSLNSFSTLDGASVLDLYAGSGALGFEALSRGAASAVFVEMNSELASLILERAQSWGVGDQAKVHCESVERYLAASKGPVFDLIFADPPYQEHPGESLLLELLRSCLVREGSLLVIEGGKDYAYSDDIAPEENGRDGLVLTIEKVKNYGKTSISYWRFSGSGNTTPEKVKRDVTV